MRCSIKIRIGNNEELLFGPGTASLMRAIEENNSVKGAALSLGLSYSKAWKIIKNAEKCFSTQIVSCASGGKGGGNTVLTEEGKRIILSYEKFEKEINECSESSFKTNFKEWL